MNLKSSRLNNNAKTKFPENNSQENSEQKPMMFDIIFQLPPYLQF